VATAKLTLPNGTLVAIEGNAAEIKDLLAHFSTPAAANSRQSSALGSKAPKKEKVGRKGPQKLLAELAEDNFFKEKRTIGDVRKKLEQEGHIYPQTSLSAPLLRLTRSKVLRRIRDKDGWVYVS
jgi:hypothetical protein